jgi:hypothetical protein
MTICATLTGEPARWLDPPARLAPVNAGCFESFGNDSGRRRALWR